jgi:hypothetical protein
MPDESPPDKTPFSKLPPEIQEAMSRLSPWLREAGVDVPADLANAVPQIYARERVGVMAHALAQNLRGSGLYKAGKELVTVDEGTGEFQLMTARRAVSWLDEWVSFYVIENKERRFVSLSRRKVEEVLAADAFLCKVPVLNGINSVKLPVRRKDGSLELLQPGYDRESGIFTMRMGLDYDENMPPDAARACLAEMLRFFPFGAQGLTGQIAAMFTVFCSGMLPLTARPPMFIWNANQVGSGKTRLAQLCLYPVFGTANLATWWDRNEDMKKELDSAAQEFVPYLFFDDQSGKLRCNLLNGFVTSSRWSGRVMGTKERFYVTLRAITFVTGNQLTYSDDILRRSRIIELFQPVQWDQRVLPPEAIDMTEEWLAADENRSRILSALWSLVKYSEDCQARQPVVPSRRMASFEGWSRVIPPICMIAKFGDPTENPPIERVNPLLNDTRELARRALDEFVQGKELHTIKLADLVPIARKNGLFVEKLGMLDDVFRELDAGKGKWKQVEETRTSMGGIKSVEKRDPTYEEKMEQAAAWLDRPTATGFGMVLKKMMAELQFTDSAGRLYQVGSREGSRQAMYVCRRIRICETQIGST